MIVIQEKDFTIADQDSKKNLDDATLDELDQLREESASKNANHKGVSGGKAVAAAATTAALIASAPRLFSSSPPEAVQRKNIGPVAAVAATSASKRRFESRQ